MGPFKKPRETNENSKDGSAVYSCLLKNEVLGYQYEDYKDVTPEKKLTTNRKLFHVSVFYVACRLGRKEEFFFNIIGLKVKN